MEKITAMFNTVSRKNICIIWLPVQYSELNLVKLISAQVNRSIYVWFENKKLEKFHGMVEHVRKVEEEFVEDFIINPSDSDNEVSDEEVHNSSSSGEI